MSPTCRRSAPSRSACRPGTGSYSCPYLGQGIVGRGYVKVTFGNKQVKDAPSIAPTASCPPATKKRSSKHYGLLRPVILGCGCRPGQASQPEGCDGTSVPNTASPCGRRPA